MKRIQNKIPPPVITLIFGLFMWSLSVHYPIKAFENVILYYSGLTFVIIGLYLDVKSLFNFRKNNTTISPISPEKATNLVIGGFYRFTRNPMYLGMLSILAGAAMLFGALSTILTLPVFIITMNELQIKPEEVALEKIFAEQYINYKQKVRRWL